MGLLSPRCRGKKAAFPDAANSPPVPTNPPNACGLPPFVHVVVASQPDRRFFHPFQCSLITFQWYNRDHPPPESESQIMGPYERDPYSARRIERNPCAFNMTTRTWFLVDSA